MGNAILEILEEMKIKQTEQSEQLTEQSRQLTKLSELQETLSSTVAIQSVSTVAEPLAPIEPQIVRHVHRLELKTSRWLIITAGLSIFLIGSTILNYNQHQAIRQLEANDLKYRYIKMKGAIVAADLIQLDTLLDDEMKKLRANVIEYEWLVRE